MYFNVLSMSTMKRLIHVVKGRQTPQMKTSGKTIFWRKAFLEDENWLCLSL